MDFVKNVSYRLVNTSSVNSRLHTHILDALPIAVSYIDKDLRFKYLNPAFERFLGRNSEAIMDKTIYEVFGKKPLEPMTAQLSNTTLSFETQLLINKTKHDAELTFTP